MAHKVTESWEGKLEYTSTWNGDMWIIDDNEKIEEILRRFEGKKIKLIIEEVKE